MAGLIAALFGGKRKPETNPHPGVGGYDLPRGPYGEGGFPGSAPAAPPTHAQTADGRRERQLTPTAAQQQWNELPTRQRSGMPRQPRARDKKQSDDTLRNITPVIGANAPGAQNVRNNFAQNYKAVPGQVREYLSAPNPAKNGGTADADPDAGAVHGGEPSPVSVPSRYVSHEGAQEGFTTDRRIPYRIHARPEGYRGAGSNRGAELSGQRYTMAAKEQYLGLPNGEFGIARKRGPLHRPVRFEQPGPWTANFRDEAPDQGTNAPQMVLVSAGAGKPGKTSSGRGNAVESRRMPGKGVRRG